MQSGNDVKKLSNETGVSYSSGPICSKGKQRKLFCCCFGNSYPAASDNLISILSNWKLVSCIHPPYPVLI